MTADKQIIDGKECKYWFRPNPTDYRKCSLRGQDDNCDEIKDCFVKELLNKLSRKEQECERLKDLANNALEKVNNYLDKKEKSLLYKQALTEIKEIARVNSINTCWTAINLCADCDETEECGLQSPFEKLKAIIQKISEVEDES